VRLGDSGHGKCEAYAKMSDCEGIVDFRLQIEEGIGHREVISNCELRIAKLGTRPKGGSPKDNFGIADVGFEM
jgi:hypothetical protein